MNDRYRTTGASRGLAATTTTIGGTWTFLGPKPIALNNYGNVSGRVTSLAVDPNNTQIVYAGTVGGGVWKSIDGGTNWTPLMRDEASLAIGSVAVDSTGQTIYAGTGEANDGSSQYGQGILKSTDGGQTWTLLGKQEFAGHHIAKIAIDRTTTGSSQKVFVASDVGLYVSTNGGATWTKNTQILSATFVITGKTASGVVVDVVQDPVNASKYWAAISDSCRTEAGNIVVSTDGGSTWSDVNHFPSQGYAYRLGLGVGPAGVAYTAFFGCPSTQDPSGGHLAEVDKTTTGGASWAALSGVPDYSNGFGWYANVIGVDPTNGDRAVFGSVRLIATSNGGTSFSVIDSGVHVDFHAVAFTGANSFFAGSDGGAYKTANLGASWTNLNATLGITEFYHGTALTTLHPLGGAQDNGTPGNFPGDPALPAFHSYRDCCDGAYTAVDGTQGSSIIYAEGQYLRMQRIDAAQFTNGQDATPCSEGSTSFKATCTNGSFVDHVGFIAPFVMDTTNPLHLLAGASRLYETTDGGVGSTHWAAISNDLTTGLTLGSGADFISRITIPRAGGTSVIFTGSQYGKVYRSTNGGTTWTDITGNLPLANASTYFFPNSWIGGIAYNPANPAEAWVSLGALDVGHVWHTTNAGAGGGTTWTDISGSGETGLPNAPAYGLIVDPTNPGTVYVGTYYGVFACTSCGGGGATGSWSRLGSGLPDTAVNWLSLTADGSTIVAWTRGRGAWTLPVPAVATVPGAPTGVSASPGNSSASVSWTPPASDGGSAIVHYDVEAFEGGISRGVIEVGNVTSMTFSPLTNGHTYTFKVTAINGVGAGPASADSNAVTPTVSKANQTITFGLLANRTYGDPDFNVSATASSGLTVSFAASGNCTIGGTTVHITGAGSCTVTASQAGDSTYNAAPNVSRSFTIAKANQTITVIAHAPFGAIYGTGFSVAAGGGASGNPIVYSSSGSCSSSGSAFTMTSGSGYCTVEYDQSGNGNYNAAPSVSESVVALKSSQTIVFGPLANRRYGDPDFSLSATASSGLVVSFVAGGSCTVSGSTVHLTGAGSCTLTASQPGDANYNPAPGVQQSFTIQAAQTPPSCTVPRVVGKTLATAKLIIKRRHCRTGTVRYAYSRPTTKGKVISQSRRPGRVLPVNAKINLLVGRGPKR